VKVKASKAEGQGDPRPLQVPVIVKFMIATDLPLTSTNSLTVYSQSAG
jgi:hypothetical protein